jgi:hypothetical protein
LNDQLVLENRQARIADELSIGVGIRVAEEHRHAEPLLYTFPVSSPEHRGQEDPTRPQPVGDTSNDRADLGTRHVEQHVQSDDPVE